LETNPLRILDSKDPGDRALVAEAPPIDAFLTSDAGSFFARVQQGLDASGVAFVRASRLVRGFDYYRHTAFEFVTDRLGAQGTVIGGGRYDGLIEAMGGPPTPAVGWAGGIERLAGLIEAPAVEAPLVAVIPEATEAEAEAIRIAGHLRAAGLSVSSGYKGNARKRAEQAAKEQVQTILYVHDADRGTGSLNLVDRARDGRAAERRLEIQAHLPSEYLGLEGEDKA
ncbi:ATP phosphoribosyltransferase regulatory subunit, partial [Thermaurantiacus sp.]